MVFANSSRSAHAVFAASTDPVTVLSDACRTCVLFTVAKMLLARPAAPSVVTTAATAVRSPVKELPRLATLPFVFPA